jgi:hypothetical protein
MFVLQMVLLWWNTQNTVSIKIQSFRKGDFIAKLTMRGIDATGNVCELKSKMNAAIEKLRAEYASVKNGQTFKC